MTRHVGRTFCVVALLGLGSLVATGAEVLTPCFLKLSLYTNITGSTVADLTADPR